MPVNKASVTTTIDLPSADVRPLVGDRGHMQSWRFDDTIHLLDHLKGDYSKPQPTWNFETGAWTCDWIPEIRALVPRATWPVRDMQLYRDAKGPVPQSGEWVKQFGTFSTGGVNVELSGLWRESATYQFPREYITDPATRTPKWLWFHDGRGMKDGNTVYGGQVSQWPGSIQLSEHRMTDDPCFRFRARRQLSPSNVNSSTCLNYMEIILSPIEGHVPAPGHQWALVLPGPNADLKHQYVSLHQRNGTADWERLEEFRTGFPAGDITSNTWTQNIQWESVDKHIILTINGERFSYWIPPERRLGGEDPVIVQPLVSVICVGHMATFNIAKAEFAGGPNQIPAQVDMRHVFELNNNVFKTDSISTYHSSWLPADDLSATTVNVTAEAEGENFRPRIQFTSPWADRRAACYVATVDWEPTISAGVGAQYDTTDKDITQRANGTLTDKWRYNDCFLEFDMPSDTVDTTVAAWKGSNHIQTTAGWVLDEGSTDTAIQFTGRLTGRTMRVDPDNISRTTVALDCLDEFWRLEKHFWLSLGCFENQRLAKCFQRVLRTCWIPDSKITYEGVQINTWLADVAAETRDPSPLIERADPSGVPRFDFNEGTGVIEGLDQIMTSLGKVWGIDQNGTWFCRDPITYSGTPDYTLDDDSLTEADFIYELRSQTHFDDTPEGKPWVNHVFVRIDRGGDEQVWWVWDEKATDFNSSKSMHVASVEDYVADDWTHVFIGHDEQSAAALANKILNERLTRQKTIHFSLHRKVDLFPDQFVKVQATGVKIATDSIFKVTEKRWEASTTGGFHCEYEARFIE